MVVAKISYVDFGWMPNPFTNMISDNYTTPNSPPVYQQSTSDLTFLRNAGGYILLIGIFAFITLIVLVLRWQGLSKPLRNFI